MVASIPPQPASSDEKQQQQLSSNPNNTDSVQCDDENDNDNRWNKALSLYEAELKEWWRVLESLAGGNDPEAMCQRIDEIVADECDNNNSEDLPPNNDDETQRKIDTLCLRANVEVEKRQRSVALSLWGLAMRLIVPKERFFVPYTSGNNNAESALYVLLGAADTLYQEFLAQQRKQQREDTSLPPDERQKRFLDVAHSSTRLAMFVPGTIGTPYAHFLNGRIKLELGDAEGATMELGRALFLVQGDDDDNESSLLFRNVSTEIMDLAQRGVELLEREMIDTTTEEEEEEEEEPQQQQEALSD